MKYISTILLTFLMFWQYPLWSQNTPSKDIKQLITKFKEDNRGPYKDIRWFCKDGSNIPPKEKCPAPGGVQRARYKEEVLNLSISDHIFLGQILSTTDKEVFWDKPNNHAQIKQYQIEKYLQSIDDGWVLRKAQYYRGAIQTEDEETWGSEFFIWLLADQNSVKQNYFLIRQAAKDIPHQGAENFSGEIRSLSKVIADAYTPFTDLRVKIHGQPEASDIPKVKAFQSKHQAKLSAAQKKQMDQLIAEMEKMYAGQDLKSLSKYLKGLSSQSNLKSSFDMLVKNYDQKKMGPDKLMDMSELLWDIRQTILETSSAKTKLSLIDLSIGLENVLFQEINEWNPVKLDDLIFKIHHLGKAAAACGFLEIWEWEETMVAFNNNNEKSISLPTLTHLHQLANRWIEWGAAMVRANYFGEINRMIAFEPLVNGFTDDRIRGSILLPLENSISRLGELIAMESGFSNEVLNIAGQSQIRDLNPGYALGELVVVRCLSR